MKRMRPLRRFGLSAGAGVLSLAASAAAAQNVQNNALQGFSQNRDQPVKIEASTLEVRDKDKVATFSGNVRLVQGDTTMRCARLVVFYEQDGAGAATGAMKPAAPIGPGGGTQSIKRLEAKGGVTITQKDQTATGENGVFDMKSNTVTLHKNVVISQGPQVLSGDRLVANLTTGVSRVECDNQSNCKVRMLVVPNAAGPARSDASAQASGGLKQ
jgi:lipopolysaccharide export system protein LptA